MVPVQEDDHVPLHAEQTADVCGRVEHVFVTGVLHALVSVHVPLHAVQSASVCGMVAQESVTGLLHMPGCSHPIPFTMALPQLASESVEQ